MALQSGLLEVYPDALSVTAFAVFQLPSAATLPTILIVWPYVVLASSLKVTATEVAVAQLVADVLVPVAVAVPVAVVTPVLGVWLAGKLVDVAEE